MKKTLLAIMTMFCTVFIYGQTEDMNAPRNDTFKPAGLTKIEANPQIRIVVDSKSYEVENFSESDLKPKWIESITVKKDPYSKKIYGNNNGVIIIYTKPKYSNKVLKIIESKSDA